MRTRAHGGGVRRAERFLKRLRRQQPVADCVELVDGGCTDACRRLWRQRAKAARQQSDQQIRLALELAFEVAFLPSDRDVLRRSATKAAASKGISTCCCGRA